MAAPMKNSMKQMFKFIDIGANLTDPVFRGVYRGGRKCHEDDFAAILQRAKDIGMEKILVTSGNLREARTAVELVKSHDILYTTIGVHPTRCGDFDKSGDPDKYMADLLALASDNRDKIVAFGECGLDYDRFQFCDKGTQLKYFEHQFEIVEALGLPMFLHCRAAGPDFLDIIKRHREKIKGGVVHSFTGSKEEAQSYMDQGLYIGINGCSLKTQDNIDAMCSIPTERLMIETDAPWCEIRHSHAGSGSIQTSFPSKKKEKWETGCCVKSRNEPCHIIQVLEVMAAARREDIADLANTMYDNTDRLFFRGDNS